MYCLVTSGARINVKKRKNMDLEVLGQYSHLCIRGDAATRTVLLQDAYSIRLITGFK